MRVCVCVVSGWVGGWLYVCVCEREREREREIQIERGMEGKRKID